MLYTYLGLLASIFVVSGRNFSEICGDKNEKMQNFTLSVIISNIPKLECICGS